MLAQHPGPLRRSASHRTPQEAQPPPPQPPRSWGPQRWVPPAGHAGGDTDSLALAHEAPWRTPDVSGLFPYNCQVSPTFHLS